MCALHDHDDSRSCRVKGCDRVCKTRHNICNTCYMREYRKKRQKSSHHAKKVEEAREEEKHRATERSSSRRVLFNGGISMLPAELGILPYLIDREGNPGNPGNRGGSHTKPHTSMMSVYIIQQFSKGVT